MIMNYDKKYPLQIQQQMCLLCAKFTIPAHGAKILSYKDLNVHSAFTLYNVHSSKYI